MEKKQYKRKRDIFIRFMVDEKERDMIHRRMEQSGIKNMRAYLLKMAIDGRVIHVEMDSVREMVRLLSNVSNNLNQIARRANDTGNIHADDIEKIRAHHEEIWEQTREILRRLSAIA
ncbi:plasmid mobilization relaxosome protein MobC [Ruminococcaceae bacterium OttesenSCG-928-L11]|nr:plasmid mobilization relaxosome protein MobC [Ruminococcaceae bacterium OttesenSCG-928-L11]